MLPNWIAEGRTRCDTPSHRQCSGRAPITYVSRQLGHKDPSVTLRVYSHWLPDASTEKLVDALDDTAPRGPQTTLTTSRDEVQNALSGLKSVVSRGGIEPPTRRLRVCCSAN